MPGVFAAIGVPETARSRAEALESIDLPGGGQHEYVEQPGRGAAGASWLPSQPRERSVYNSDEVFMSCAGNVAAREMPWEPLLADLRANASRTLTQLNGRFAIICWDRSAGQVHLITDPIGQHPLFFHHAERRLVASTTIATFCRLLPEQPVDDRWLYETFAFNYPVSNVTALRGVARVPPASVLTYNLADDSITTRRYLEQLDQRQPLMSPDEAAEVACGIFRECVPAYLEGARRPAMGVTAGFDSRTILAFIGIHPGLLTFSYGVPGCDDVLAGKEIAHALGRPFLHLPFDSRFEANLPELMRQTVYLSSGTQGVNRATLLYAYSQLAAGDQPPDVVLSGVSGDQLFRGHGNVPSIVSPLMNAAFCDGRIPMDLRDSVSRAFNREADCQDHLDTSVAALIRQFGALRAPLTHLRYLTYITPSRYFCGETSIADHFFDFRSPFCDRRILELAYSTTASTLGLSKFAAGGKTLNHRKNFLPAQLVCSEPRLAALQIHGRPTPSFKRRGYVSYYLQGALRRLRSRLRGSGQRSGETPPLEAWNQWFRSTMRPTLEEELKPGARIEQFVRRDFIERALRNQDIYWLNKLVSMELVLKLTGNGWRFALK